MDVLPIKEKLIKIYDEHYFTWMIVTLLILVLAVSFIGVKYLMTGQVIDRGITLKGGVEFSFATKEKVDLVKLQDELIKKLNSKDLSVRSTNDYGVQKEVIVEASDVSSEAILAGLKEVGIVLQNGEYTSQQIGSKLGEAFFKQTIFAVLFAFAAMAIVIYITFRDLVPSAFVVLCAFADVTTAFAVVSLLGVKLSIAGVAAFLMLLGYSVDTDILLTTRVLKNKEEGKVLDHTLGAMRTGITMSLTSFVAVVISYFLTKSSTIQEIMLILSIGLIADIYNTWLLNAGILRWHMEGRHGKN